MSKSVYRVGSIALVFWFFQSCIVFAQTDSTKQVFPDSAQVMNDLKFLSADTLQGRKTGTKGNAMAREFILNRLLKIGVSAFVSDYIQTFEIVKSEGDTILGKNVIGFVQGFDSDNYLVISAHYDHIGMKDSSQIFNGADDNASGAAALLAIAAYFQSNQPDNNIIIAFFDAEEQGLLGAKHFMQSISVDSSKIKLNVNMDMVGRADKNEIYAVGTHFTPSLKPSLLEAAKGKSVSMLFGRDVPKKKPYWVNSSDHAPFHQANIPFVYFGVDDHADYHESTDTFEKIDPQKYLEIIRLIKDGIENLDADLQNVQYGK